MNNIQNRLKNNVVCFADVNDVNLFYHQIDIIKQHKLYDIFDIVFVHNNKNTIVLDKKSILLEYSLVHSNIMVFIKEFANMTKNIKIFYFHSKKFSENIQDDVKIRNYLNYFLIEKYKLCIDALDKYTIVHANACFKDPFKYFWWTNSDYIKELEDIARFGNSAYTDCRMWLTLCPMHSNKPYVYEAISSNILAKLQTLYIKRRPIYGCYFIYCHGAYLKIIDEQIDLLLTNGLYNITDTLYVFVCDVTQQCIKKFEKLTKVKLICTKENLCEKYAINNYKQYIKQEPYFLYYFHAKGVSKSTTFLLEKQEIVDWRNMCNYFTLVKWRLCLELLEFYDCVGANLTNFPRRHFSGNFWWATSEHLNILPNVGQKWLAPELYICQNAETKCVSLHQSPMPLGSILYNKSNYNKKTDKQLLSEITAIPIFNISASVCFDMWYDVQTADEIDKLVFAFYKSKAQPRCIRSVSKVTTSYQMSPFFLKCIALNNKKLKSNIV